MGWRTENVQMSTQTLWFLIVVISWSFDHQTMIFAWISLRILSIHPQIMKIRHLQHCSGFSCLSSALGKQFCFLMKQEFASCKFAAFEHFSMYKHPSLCGLPALVLLPFFYPLCRSTNSWRWLLLQVYLGTGLCTEAPISDKRGTYGLGNFYGRRRTTFQQASSPLSLLFLPLKGQTLLLAWDCQRSTGLVSLAGISPSACCAECGSPT